jgi:hypothetical protein
MPDDFGDENGKIETRWSVFLFNSGVVALLLLLADCERGDNSENSRRTGLAPNLNGQLRILILEPQRELLREKTVSKGKNF